MEDSGNPWELVSYRWHYANGRRRGVVSQEGPWPKVARIGGYDPCSVLLDDTLHVTLHVTLRNGQTVIVRKREGV